MMQLASSVALLRIATELVEDDDLLPQDIEYITTKCGHKLWIIYNCYANKQTMNIVGKYHGIKHT